MIRIDLPVHAMLEKQLPMAREALGLGQGEAEDIFHFRKHAIIHDGGWEIVDEKGLHAAQQKNKEAGLAAPMCHYGPEALAEMAKAKGVAVPVFEKVEIPGYVWAECKLWWDDICLLCMRIEERASRYGRLLDMGAPDIIMRNEARMLNVSVAILEENKGGEVKWDDGSIAKSLNDIGYTLADGGKWLPWKKKLMEEREAAARRAHAAVMGDGWPEDEDAGGGDA